MKRNGILYNMDEKTAFKYMKLYLPVNVLNGTEEQSVISLLKTDLTKFAHKQKQQSFDMKDPSKWHSTLSLIIEVKDKTNYLMTYLFIILQPDREKTLQEQKECLKIFSALENDFNINDSNPNMCMLKSRYFAYSHEPEKALEHCKRCAENGKGKIGNHFNDIVTEGFLLSAKCKSKSDYNFFYKYAVMIDLLKHGMLKTPANTKVYNLVQVPGNITEFLSLSEEYDCYFFKKFT